MGMWDTDGDEIPKNEKEGEQYRAKKFIKDIEERPKKDLPRTYGICSTCGNFTYIKTRYGKELAYCSNSQRHRPSPMDPIIVCSDFYPNGQLPLEALWAMATFIDVKPEKKVGFIIKDVL